MESGEIPGKEIRRRWCRFIVHCTRSAQAATLGYQSMIHFVVADSNQVRLQRARTWLVHQARNSEVLILAPHRGAADHLLRSACRATNGMLGVHRMTLPQWAAQLAVDSMAEVNSAPLSALAARVLASRCVARCRNTLEYFTPVVATPGFSGALAGTLSELRLQQVQPWELEKLSQPGPDLARLLECFEEEMETNSLSDPADLLLRATQRVKEGRPHRLGGLPTLFLDLVPATEVEKRLVAAVAATNAALWITLLRADVDGVKAWTRIVGNSPEIVEESPAEAEKSSLSRIRRFVFSPRSFSARPPDESISFFSAVGEGGECVEIVRSILMEAGQGVRFDQMVVLLRNPDLYQPLLEESLARAGVPAYFSRGTVRPDPAGRAFLTLLACAAERLSASRFAEYLSLGQAPQLEPSSVSSGETPWVDPGGGILFTFKTLPAQANADRESKRVGTDSDPVVTGALGTPIHWQKFLDDAAVIGSRSRWEKRLRGLESEFRLRLRELEEEAPYRHAIHHQLRQLEHLKNLALPIIEFLDGFPSECRWGEWLRLLRRLAALALNRPDSVLAILAELEPMKQVGPVTLAEVQNVLTEWLRCLRTKPLDRPYGKIFVGRPQEAGARSFEIVFVPGLGDGSFPQKTREDPLLLDEFRQRLGRDLKLREGRSRQERLLLRQAAAAARRRLVISYPRMEVVQGRSRAPSFYALDILRASEGRLPDIRELENRAAAAGESRLGWPAPREAEKAIDEAEYDLSLLDRLLRSPGEESRGRARFLLKVNPCLARSLRARARRWRRPWTQADGLVDASPEVTHLLNSHRLTARAYSPTALQNFAVCPYRFLLHSIHKLRPRDKPEAVERMDPLTRGSLFHAVQARLSKELQASGLLPLPHGDLLSVLDLADQVLTQVAAEYEEELAPAIPRIWRNEVEDLRLDLRGWIRAMALDPDQWIPAYFEFAFGLPKNARHDARSRRQEAVILNGVRLRGAIDVIEENRWGTFRITDHKTGKKPPRRVSCVGGGEMLQPLLYALAAERILAQPVQGGRLFFCTRRGDYRTVEVPLDDTGRRQIGQVLETIDESIGRGFFPAAPRRDACSFCDYRSVCGPYEELRVERKDQRPLAKLQSIRKLP